jgi:hypothetical protein
MRILFSLLLIGIFGLAGFAQGANVEANFEKNKARYKLDRFAEGEDSSSGYDYLVYTNKGKVVLWREIWSSLSHSTYRIDDYFYENDKLVAVLKYTFPKKHYRTAKRGVKVPLKLVEKMYFTDSKLTFWSENGEAIPESDARWRETEKNVPESAGYRLERFQDFKKKGY